jgi:hypothetical protein
MAGFKTFNEGYVEMLKRWTLFRDGLNPVARSNVAPEISPPRTLLPRVLLHRARGSWRRQLRRRRQRRVARGRRISGDIVARGDVLPPD